MGNLGQEMQKQENHIPSQRTFLRGYTVFAVLVGALLITASRTLPFRFFEEVLVVIVPPLFYAVLHYPPRIHRLCLVIVAVVTAVVQFSTTVERLPQLEDFYTSLACLILVIVSAELVSWSVQNFRGAETDRERAEEALRESEERYRTVVENTEDFAWKIDMDGSITFASCAVERLYGYKPSELLGQPFTILLNEESTREAIESLERRKKGELSDRGLTSEFTHQRKDGTEFIAEVRSRPVLDSDKRMIEIVGVTRDITERKRAEKELQKEKDRLSALLSNTADLIAAMDADYTILFMSNALVKEFGERTGEKCYRAFCGLEEPCGVNCSVDEVIKNGRDMFEYSHRATEDVRSGRVRGDAVQLTLQGSQVLETVSHPFLYEGKRCVMEVSRDITERKRLEDQLRQAQKMEAVGNLAGGIAHDFNNILQGIMGYADMAKMNLLPSDQVYQEIEQILKGADRAATLTRQLLAFSRRQMIRPVDLDLNDVIAGVSNMLHRVIGEHIELDLKFGADTRTVHADGGTLEQVLLNLCVNARDAMPTGGQLTIETDQVVLDGGFCETHPWASPGDYALVSVTDTGVGIPPDVVDHIFEPFFTTKETGKGTGLGLSMVYGIVKQHEGLVHCYSEPNKGTCFKIYLPSVERIAATDQKANDTPEAVGGTETILLAEDDEMVREIAVITLERSGYKVLAAKDGEEALQFFEKHREDIQFALLDVVMPKVSGRGVYDAIRALKPDLPVLFSSGYNTNAIHTGFVVEEGLETIQKPYSPNALLHKIREVLDGG